MKPTAWETAPLCEVGDCCLGKMLDRVKNRGRPLPYLRNTNVRWHSFDLGDVLTMPFEDDELERYGLVSGDVLICEGGEPGRAAVWSGEPSGMKFQKALHRVRPNAALLPQWLVYQLDRDARAGVLTKHFTGTTIKHLPGSQLAQYSVHLPPLNEQRRIVAKLDALLARSRRAKEALDAIPALLEQLRQSVLSAAFRGDLTADWRAKHPEVEPASELLKRIRVERRRKWEEAELAKMRAKGKAPSDDRWKEKYKEPEPVDASELPELPEGWCWASLTELSHRVTDGTHQPPKFVPSGVPFLVIANIVDGSIDWQSIDKWVSEETYADLTAKWRPQRGDVLYTAVGSFGTALVVDTDEKFIFQRHIAHVRPIGHLISADWLALILNAPQSFSRADDLARGVAQRTVTLGDLAEFPFPVGPADEQHEIVRRVRAALDRGGVMRQVRDEMRARIDTLESSLLAKAFRGELVPQDPSDEPASVLLERIRASRPVEPKKRGRRSRASAGDDE